MISANREANPCSEGSAIHIRTFNHHTLHPGNEGKSGGIHPYYEMLHIMNGQGILEWMGVEYEISSPSLFLLTPNTPHWLVRIYEPIDFCYIELDIWDCASFPSVEQAIIWNRLQGKADYDSADMQCLKQTLEALNVSLECKYRSNIYYDEEIALLDIKKAIRLVHNYLRVHSTGSKPADKTTRDSVQMLMRYMESNYYNPIDLTDLSSMVHLTSSYLVRAFKNETGDTPMHYLNKLRLNAAISYLANTEMRIKQIAEATGFNSIHYFSRLFKLKYGISPQQWRITSK